ncbi:MAG: acyl-ACP--UDP-N-acetylglucosamine O-acyltransferase [Bacteroidales bacterium]|nr:acyl-ACP--UDP-N-acetylglucosamine O-acyltransferase [Bacteroidales bacterium]
MKQPLANIHPDAKIADNVVIEPFATIQGDVVIEEGSWIGPNAVLMDGTRIGKNCNIYPGAVIAAIPQDLKFVGEKTTVEIGDNTNVREYVTISRGTKAKMKTVIGSNCLIMAYSHVAHDCIIGDNCILVNGVQLAGEVEIDDWAILGGTVVIHQFVRIGKHVFMAGRSGALTDVPPYAKVAGVPCDFIGLNAVGLRRRGFTTEKIAEIQEIYRIIYQKGMNNSQALEHIEKNIPQSEERDEILNFYKGSKRGVINARKGEIQF